MSILLPTALFSALGRTTVASEAAALPSDELRDHFLRFSRGTAVILLVMWVPVLPLVYVLLKLTVTPVIYALASS